MNGGLDKVLLNKRSSCFKPLHIGIAGGSGSGKSTLANAVLKTLGGRVLVIEQDSYYACCSRLTTVAGLY